MKNVVAANDGQKPFEQLPLRAVILNVYSAKNSDKNRVLAPKKYRRKGGQENVWLTRCVVVVYAGKQCDHESATKCTHHTSTVNDIRNRRRHRAAAKNISSKQSIRFYNYNNDILIFVHFQNECLLRKQLFD